MAVIVQPPRRSTIKRTKPKVRQLPVVRGKAGRPLGIKSVCNPGTKYCKDPTCGKLIIDYTKNKSKLYCNNRCFWRHRKGWKRRYKTDKPSERVLEWRRKKREERARWRARQKEKRAIIEAQSDDCNSADSIETED